MRWMREDTSSRRWRVASTLAAVGTTAGAVWWLGLLATRFMGVTRLTNDESMSRLFLAGALALGAAALPGAAFALARQHGALARRIVLSLAATATVAYLLVLRAGHVPFSDADYRGSSDTDILVIAVGWTFVAWQLWRVRQQS